LNSMSIPCSRRALTRRRRQISRVQQAQRASKLAARTSSIQIGIPRAVPVRKAFAVSAELLFGTTGGCAGPSFKGVEGGEKAGSGGITAGSGAESGGPPLVARAKTKRAESAPRTRAWVVKSVGRREARKRPRRVRGVDV